MEPLTENTLSTIKRIRTLNLSQRKIVLALFQKIRNCEGDIPDNYWCVECINSCNRIEELICRFEKINKLYKLYKPTPEPLDETLGRGQDYLYD